MFLHLKNKIDRYFLISFILFLSFFTIAAIDTKISNLLYNFLYESEPWRFWIGYFGFSIFLISSLKSFVSLKDFIFIKKETNLSKKLIMSLKIILLAYLLGAIINASNAFILVAFDRFIYV